MERRHDWVIVASVGTERARVYCGRRDRPEHIEESALAHAVQRASHVTPLSRIIPVVLDEHRPWWAPLLGDIPKQNLVVEPFDRGTAAGILLAAVRLLRRDPKSSVAILSADADRGLEDVDGAYRSALELSFRHDTCAGVTCDGAVNRLAWLPAGEVEMIAGSIQHLIALFQAAQPKLLQTFLRDLRGPALFADDALDAVYPFLPEIAFNAGVLEPMLRPERILPPVAVAPSITV